jgi:hypothetical protein
MGASVAAVLFSLWLQLTALPGEAHAYLDPGTGSILVQLLLGGVAGVLAIVKLYWRRLRLLVGRARAEPTGPTDRPRR